MPLLPPLITSRTNARVKALRASLSGEARRPGDLLGLEGEHLIQEAHLAGLTFQTVFLREGSESLPERFGWAKDLRTEAWAVLSSEVFDASVSTASPRGIAATWVIEQPVINEVQPNVLVLEGLQDPGNFGTLIRSAFALGTSTIMVTPETVNQWNPKVVRAAAGAIFRVPVARLPIHEIAIRLKAGGVRSFAAIADSSSGPECGTRELAASQGALAGSIANAIAPSMHRSKNGPSEIHEEMAAHKDYAASMCYDTDFVEPCAILIGNEGAGLSTVARRLADEQVYIPCKAESLNAAVAGSILLYEVMRQRMLRVLVRRQGLYP